MKKVLYILGDLDDNDAEWLGTVGFRRTLEAGEHLIREGHPIDALYFVIGGTFAVTVGESRFEVDRAGVGEVLGEVTFIDRGLPTATVTAVESLVVLEVPRETLEAKLQDDPAFAGRFYRAVAVFLADRLRNALRRESGKGASDPEGDELDLRALDSVSRAGARFERILRRLQTV